MSLQSPSHARGWAILVVELPRHHHNLLRLLVRCIYLQVSRNRSTKGKTCPRLAIISLHSISNLNHPNSERPVPAGLHNFIVRLSNSGQVTRRSMFIPLNCSRPICNSRQGLLSHSYSVLMPLVHHPPWSILELPRIPAHSPFNSSRNRDHLINIKP